MFELKEFKDTRREDINRNSRAENKLIKKTLTPEVFAGDVYTIFINIHLEHAEFVKRKEA